MVVYSIHNFPNFQSSNGKRYIKETLICKGERVITAEVFETHFDRRVVVVVLRMERLYKYYYIKVFIVIYFLLGFILLYRNVYYI